MSSEHYSRWAIIGAGEVSRKFTLDLKHANARAEIVVSRNPENAARFAATLSIPRFAKTYEEAFEADVDAFYIATPPALHEPHALMAIAAGKPVIVEKPFAQNAAAARRIAEAARRANVLCAEGLWTRFQPVSSAVSACLKAGELGEIRGFEARFMAANQVDAANGLFDPERGGGALMHRGIYPLSLARHFLGPVEDMSATAHIGDTGVDEDSVLVLRHASEAISTLRASLRSDGPSGATISGTRATLHLQGPIYRPTGAFLMPVTIGKATAPKAPRKFEALRESHRGLKLSGAVRLLKGYRARRGLAAAFEGNGYHYQAQALMQAQAAGLSDVEAMPLDQSVEIMELVDQARTVWGMSL